jgi:hypothetical protein
MATQTVRKASATAKASSALAPADLLADSGKVKVAGCLSEGFTTI